MRTDICFRLVLSLIAAGLLVSADTAHAQPSGLQIPLQFDFLSPGARSMALGSAFVGLADDATAAITNPAGLVRLVKSEVSFEVRGRRFQNTFLQGGRLAGLPTNQGIDRIGNPVYGEFIDSNAGLSFLSLVYPGRRWAVSAYRHELVRVSGSFETTGAFFTSSDNIISRFQPSQAARDLDITNYGGAFAFKVSDRVSLGGGVSVYQFKLDQTQQSFLSPGFGPPEFSPQRYGQLVTQEGSNAGVGFNVGVLVKVHPKVQIGAVYRSGPDFEFSFRSSSGPVAEDGLRFRAPYGFSVGASYRPTDALLLTLEYDLVGYSRLEDEYVTHLSKRFSIEDSFQTHVGVEWILTKIARTPSLRFGAWNDPAHGVVYDPSRINEVPDAAQNAFSAAFAPPGKDLIHITFGGGLPVSERVELNAGADISSRSRLFSVSAVVRF